MNYDFCERLSGVDLADASAQPSALAQSNESSKRLYQRRILREGDQGRAAVSREGQGRPGQLQQHLLLAVTETGHPVVFLSRRRPSRYGDAFPARGNSSGSRTSGNNGSPTLLRSAPPARAVSRRAFSAPGGLRSKLPRSRLLPAKSFLSCRAPLPG